MKMTIQKWGNSLALRIPSSFARDAHVEKGTQVDLSIAEGRLIIAPVEKSYSLNDLVGEISKRNLHGEVDTGERLGKEIW